MLLNHLSDLHVLVLIAEELVANRAAYKGRYNTMVRTLNRIVRAKC